MSISEDGITPTWKHPMPTPCPQEESLYERIPKTLSIAGQQFTVRSVERTDDNGLGQCQAGTCEIEIAERFNKDEIQAEDSCVNTFYHELIHAILINMGYDELNQDHKFVCSFSALLTEAMKDARFIVKKP